MKMKKSEEDGKKATLASCSDIGAEPLTLSAVQLVTQHQTEFPCYVAAKQSE